MPFKQSPTLKINQETKRLIAEGKNVCKLGFGQSPFPVPQLVLEEYKKHAHIKDYIDTSGLYELKKSVARFYTDERNIPTNPEQIIIGPGSKELIYLVQLALKSDLILASPSWVSYAPQALMVSQNVVWIRTVLDNNYKIDFRALETALSSQDSKLLILNYPNNPTGVSFTKTELEEISKVCKKYKVMVIADEIYSRLQFKGRFYSLAAFYPEGTIISSGISKWCGAGGWRLGLMRFPQELIALKDTVVALGSETFSCVNATAQYAAVKAYNDDKEIENYISKVNAILNFVSETVIAALEELNITCSQTEGGFYTFISLENHRSLLEEKNIYTSEQLCNHLLQNELIALLPGTAFGREPKELTARLAFVDFDGKALIENFNNSQQSFVLSRDFPNIKLFLDKFAKFLS